jgi:hypothetical protein
MNGAVPRKLPFARQKLFMVLLLLSSVLVAYIALIVPTLTNASTPAPQQGRVALRDYTAPYTFKFPSAVVTEQLRQEAERAVQPIFTSPDTSVARQQLERLRTAFAYINSVRNDSYATTEQKLADLAALEDLRLERSTALTILGLTDPRWQEIQQETLVVLESVMSGVIRPELVDETQERIPSVVSLSLSESQADLVAGLTSAFVVPNSEYSEELTRQARQKARDAVEPFERSLSAGETIIRQGEIFDPQDIEALEEMGLVEPQAQWQDLVSAAILAVLIVLFMIVYLRRKRALFLRGMRGLAVVVALLLAFLLVGRLIIPAHVVLPFIFPAAAYSLTIAALFGTELALVSSLPLAVLLAFNLPGSLELTVYYMISSMFGVLALARARRLTSFFGAGAAVGASCATMILVYRLPLPSTDMIGLLTLIGAASINGLASASIAILLQFFLAQFLGLTTPMQLIDLTRPDHPLLQLLLRDAPGTYQHSLQVANLAEQAAERIGADPLLTRVGALYHDVGKTLNPVFFIENQLPGSISPHQGLAPVDSAGIIIRHVTDGVELSRRYRLPQPVIDFMTEHHGTLITRYQYVEAVKAAGGDESQVDIERFRYPGPRPQSRETALLMLADGSEARVRAERPKEDADLRDLIRSVINDRISKGQLDDTRLTLSDLDDIVDSFAATLVSAYHPRIQYPKLEAPGSTESAAPQPHSSESPTIPVPHPDRPIPEKS